jgi:hypothetical protein
MQPDPVIENLNVLKDSLACLGPRMLLLVFVIGQYFWMKNGQ